MKNILVIVVLCFGGCKADQKPILEIDNQDYKFDTCRITEKISHTFNLKNVGNENLVISRIHTTCNCTVAFADSIFLKPSEKTGLRVEYDPALFGDSGFVVQKIALRNNSDSSIVFLSLSGYVKNH